ncbi:uncharacterized protein TNCV_595521 [Trichonephila clavipes]|nr:uncharacterized protein TNCV_595521 [Trichonephila clavipes]
MGISLQRGSETACCSEVYRKEAQKKRGREIGNLYCSVIRQKRGEETAKSVRWEGLSTFAKQSFWLRGKNRLGIFTLRLTGGAHRYHCSRRKQKPTADINKVLTGGAQRTSLNQSPGDQNRGFSTADSHWLGTRACAVLAISLRCQSMFTARLEILTLKLGEWGATSVVLLVTQLKFQITRSMSVEFVTIENKIYILLLTDYLINVKL